MFYMSMLTGSLISISSSSWITAWMGLELNLMSILPLMKNIKYKNSSESTIKYFIVQAIASTLMLFSIIMMTNLENFQFSFYLMNKLNMITASALLMKMGAAPFHFWIPEVTMGLSWKMVYIILTWQKLAPMILIINTIYNNIMFMSIIIILSSMMGSILGMNQTYLKKLMSYSSINHISWMLAASLCSYSTWLIYYIIYCMMNTNIIIMLNKYKMNSIYQLINFLSKNKQMKMMFMMNFLSLGGLPPFLGFLPKWITINQLINNNYYTITFILILFSLISLYFYLRISFSSFMFYSTENLININQTMNFNMTMMNMINIMGMIMYPLLYFSM
uniref:NADH dehydrogenase subunit 2 n=1 Tax=Tomicus yunnanensis TaxID=768153 RepID=UPI002551DA21|nr:NADH dehydrogenase subunit 2 [Tomicus yunnanensis]WGL40305.1 NADH dehydrogenase subunit 2 [Tomicus yunnanensis]